MSGRSVPTRSRCLNALGVQLADVHSLLDTNVVLAKHVGLIEFVRRCAGNERVLACRSRLRR